MAYRFEFSPRMLAQVDEIYEYIAGFSTSRAETWYAGLFAEIETLGRLPARCPVVEPSADPLDEVRMMLYGQRRAPYQVLFTIRGDVIQVIRVRHSRQPEDS